MTAPGPAIPIVPATRLRRRPIAKHLARRIDRLSRRAHRFHRFAHHPLCTRYAGEVIRIGRVRLCRGCTFAIAGGLAGGALGLALGGSAAVAAVGLGAATSIVLATLWSRVRPPKLVTRLVPAAGFAVAFTCGVLARDAVGFAVAGAALAVAGVLRVLYGRRGGDRTPCTTCPELAAAPGEPCSGVAPIVSRERAFQRVVAGWLAGDQAIRRSATSSGDGPRIERSR